jgi:MFS family permease
MSELVRYKNRILMPILYGLASVIAVYFLTKSNAFNGYECTGNYVIFQIGRIQSLIYSAYYFGLIAVSIWIGARHHRINVKKRFDEVWWLTIGYLVFIVPVAVMTVVHPDTRKAVPSILCGFAVTLAIILVSLVSPLTLRKR